jgi:hypothetical protein
MNIYELNNLISALENENKESNTDLLGFYYKKRKELNATLSQKINKLLA